MGHRHAGGCSGDLTAQLMPFPTWESHVEGSKVWTHIKWVWDLVSLQRKNYEFLKLKFGMQLLVITWRLHLFSYRKMSVYVWKYLRGPMHLTCQAGLLKKRPIGILPREKAGLDIAMLWLVFSAALPNFYVDHNQTVPGSAQAQQDRFVLGTTPPPKTVSTLTGYRRGRVCLVHSWECFAGFGLRGSGTRAAVLPWPCWVRPNMKEQAVRGGGEAGRGDESRRNATAACEAGPPGSSLHPVPASLTVPPLSFLNSSHGFGVI